MGAIHLAVRRRDLDKVKELVDEGHDVNGLDHHGNTPLILAAQRSYQITSYLLRHGASSSLRTSNSDEDTPLTVAEDDKILNLLNKYLVDAMDDEISGFTMGDEYGPGLPEPDGNIW
ncbi:hypothetical protein BDW75DRAFT_244029 [Aspergillus navahoensis]